MPLRGVNFARRSGVSIVASARDADPAFVAIGQRAGDGLRLVAEADPIEDLLGPQTCGPAAHRPPAEAGGHVFEHREGGEEANGLERAGNAEAGNIVGQAACDVAAVRVDPPCRHALKAGKDVDQRALAGSVRADQAEDLIPRELDREVLKRGEAPETDGDTVRSESRKTVPAYP